MWAAATAASRSAATGSGMVPTCSPVAGLITSNVSVPAPAVKAPPMNSRCDRGGVDMSYLPRTAAGGFQGPSAISRRTYSITASMILLACRRVPAAATSRAPSPMIEVRMLA